MNIGMANRYMKSYSTSSVREMKVTTTVRYQILPIRVLRSRKTKDKDAAKHLGRKFIESQTTSYLMEVEKEQRNPQTY